MGKATVEEKHLQRIGFGVTVKDCITGFSGVVTGFTTYITGCNQYLIQPPVKESGEFQEGRWYDEARLQPVLDKSVIELPEQKIPAKQTSGPDKPAPIR